MTQTPPGELKKFDSDAMLAVDPSQIPSDLKLFSHIEKFISSSFFVQTNFHLAFSKYIETFRKRTSMFGHKSTVAGIQGIGKTSSALYYVLKCLKIEDKAVHYINLEKFEKRKNSFEKLKSVLGNFTNNDCLILIDHVTLLNMHLVQSIEALIDSEGLDEIKLLLIETGLTSSVYKSQLHFRKDFQLSEEEFVKIWDESLASYGDSYTSVVVNCKDVYMKMSGEFVMTPRLLNNVLVLVKEHKKTLMDTISSYKANCKKEIDDFIKMADSRKSEEIEKFILHTRILLSLIVPGEDYFLQEEDYREFQVAINIFDCCSVCVTKEQLETSEVGARLLELGLKEGDVCYRLSHLVPYLAYHWKKKLPYNVSHLDLVQKFAENDRIFKILFQRGIGWKALESMLVKFQQRQQEIISPKRTMMETQYNTSTMGKCILYQSYMCLSKCNFNAGSFHYEKESITSITIESDIKGHSINVARCSKWIKDKIQYDEKAGFLLYPQIANLMGLDYFVYLPTERYDDSEIVVTAKKLKTENVLMCVQVALGTNHDGTTMAKALGVVKSILPDVIVHGVVLIATQDKSMYTLTGNIQFSNLSVLNLIEYLKYFDKQDDLYKLLTFCIERNSQDT